MLAYAWDGVPLPGRTRVSAAPVRSGPLRHEAAEVDCVDRGRGPLAAGLLGRPAAGIARARWRLRRPLTWFNAVGRRPAAVELGGIAFAGTRGVSKVEVRADEGDWQPAELRDPLSDATWVLWRARLATAPGAHMFAVRAYDVRRSADRRRTSIPGRSSAGLQACLTTAGLKPCTTSARSGIIRAMKRITFLAALVTVGSLSLGVAAFQQPPAAPRHPRSSRSRSSATTCGCSRAAAATPPSSCGPTASPSSTRRTPAGASRSSTRSRRSATSRSRRSSTRTRTAIT